jgi:cysteine-S-conjugate beta-lyase
MGYNFDKVIERRGSGSVKWEYMQSSADPEKWLETAKVPGGSRIIPMWVADMDFESPPAVIDTLKKRAGHGIFGYTVPGEHYYRCIIDWFNRHQNWHIESEWICVTFGVVPAINLLVQAFTSPGDGVLVQRPVYYPFFGAIERNGRSLVNNPLICQNGRYRMDFADLEKKARDPSVRLAILCSPHNPVGRVWTEEELTRFGKICLDNDVLVVSDEIHGDLVYKRGTFVPFGGLNDRFSKNSIICTAPSKTFNLAGLQTSNIIIHDEEMRNRFKTILRSNGVFGINPFGQAALEAAYGQSEEWLEHLLDYLEDNLKYMQAFAAKNLPGIEIVQPEGTYLVWLDFRGLGVGARDLRTLMLEKAGIHFDEGFIFGPEGEGFERINIACPRSILAEALSRIADTLKTEGYI